MLVSAAQLKLQALTDNLITLFNQWYLIDELSKLIVACAVDGGTVSIVLLDIDDFKVFNDTYGHLRGNQVLCQFAALLKERSGAGSYMAARYGGEEFVVALPGCGQGEAFRFADAALRELVHETFSVSGGVAEYARDAMPDEWIRRANTNMYAAKRAGKNRIVG